MNNDRQDKELSRKQFFSKWLEQLQQESWQLELLISGFALFGIYEGKSWINDFSLSLTTNAYSTAGNLASFLRLLLDCGWTIFFINLLVHVILRGLWIGAIGLRYVSQEIDYDSLNYSSYFTKYLKSNVGEYDDFIERLERLCSVLFAYTFLLFLLLLSLLLFFAVYGISMTIAVKLGSAENPDGLMVGAGLVYLVLGLLVFLDFVTLGVFKKVQEPIVAKTYMWIYRFYSIVTLSFLYRPLLYNFIDDKYTRRLFFLSIPYIFIVLFSNNIISNNPYPYWSADESQKYGLYLAKMNYEDQRKQWYSENSMKKELTKEGLPYMTLSQMKVDERYLEIFLKMKGDDQYLLSERDSLVGFEKAGLRFSLFSSDRADDPNLEALDDQRKLASKPYRDRRKEIRKKRLKGNEETRKATQATLDSLSTIVDEIHAEWDQKKEQYRAEKVQKIIDTFLKYSQLSIDGVPIQQDMDCFMYQHPNFEEHGILCMYDTDSLSLGRHTISLKRELYRSGSKENRVRSLEVPFYKVK